MKSISARGAGDVAADDAEGLAERALDQRDAVHQPALLGNAAAARAVEPDRMDLVEVGHRAVLLGDIEDLADRGDVAVHRVDALEGDDLRPVGLERGELAVEVGRVVVLPDPLLGARMADSLDHRGMVQRVREDHRVRQAGPERAERRPVRDVARGEEQRRFLAVQVGELALEQHVIVGGAGDVAGAAGARAGRGRSPRASPRAPPGAGPCRDSRSSTRP